MRTAKDWTTVEGDGFKNVFDQLCDATGDDAYGEAGEKRRRDKAAAYWRVLAKHDPWTVMEAGRKLAGSCRRMPPAADWADMCRTIERSRRPENEATYADVCSICNGRGWELYTPLPDPTAPAPKHPLQEYARRCQCPPEARVPNPKATPEQHAAFMARVDAIIARKGAPKEPRDACTSCGESAVLEKGLCLDCADEQAAIRAERAGGTQPECPF